MARFNKGNSGKAIAIASKVIVVETGHDHVNLALLQTYTQSESGLADAVTKKHAHVTSAITDLNQTIANPPTQAEVQSISDKIDEMLTALRTADIIT